MHRTTAHFVSAVRAAAFCAACLHGLRAEAAWPAVFNDSLGREVKVLAPPKRIVSLAPSNTEILFALGAGDRVVAVTTFCDFPEEARSRPKIGGFAATTINLETLVALRPALVLAGDEAQRAVVESLETLGVPAISIKARDFEGVYASIALIGRLAEREEAAATLTISMRRRVTAVARRAERLEPVARLRVYWEVFDAPVMTAGPRSIIGQLITLAGGINVFSDVVEEFPQVSAEAVVSRDPQVILAPDMAKTDPLTVEKLRRRPGWANVTAVREGQVRIVSADVTSRPGPRLVEGLEQVSAALYPSKNYGEGR